MAQETELDGLLSRWEELEREGKPANPEDLCRERPELLDAFRAQLRALRGVDALLGDVDPTTEPGSPRSRTLSTQSTYQIVRPHAAGGLGEVLLARDECMGRDVALKVIRQPLDRDPARRSRFLREAEITGRLEHPGVVPVYGLGVDEAGRPHYVMRFIEGETLQTVLRQFHAADGPGRDPGERRLALRQLLARFVAVCNTVAYAHSQGVIHRDLKPSNILPGAYGETVVLDWGLAKRLGQAEADVADNETPSPDAGATRLGTSMGTPAYMSPEQAAGEWDRVGPASDVYSLGATLYAILTGHPPVESDGPEPVLERVRRGSFLHPSERKPGTPPALEAICLKALALRPEDRYASALALAEDVEHWLADEPVGAYPEPWTARARRWVGRHRTLVTSLGAAGVVAVLILSVTTVLLSAANERQRQASDEARAEKRKAEESFLQARQAVDDYFTLVSQNKLIRVPGLQPLRKELLETALRYYQDFLRDRGDDPANRANVAGTLSKIAQIVADTGSITEALDWHQRALTAWRAVHAAHPENPDYTRQLAQQLFNMGPHQRRAGKLADALRSEEEAEAILVPFVRERPEDDAAANLLGKTYVNLALIQGSLGKSEDAIRSGRKGLEVREGLRRRTPNDRTLALNDAIAYQNLGSDLLDLGRLEEALESYERSRDTYRALLGARAVDPALQNHTIGQDLEHGYGGACQNVGIALQGLGRFRESVPPLEEAVRVYREEVRKNPDVVNYQGDVARAQVDLAAAYLELGELDRALAAYEQVRDVAGDVVRRRPALVYYLGVEAAGWDGIGQVRARQGRRPDAEAAFATAAARHRQAREKAPDMAELRNASVYHYRSLAAAQRHWREPARAAASVRAAVELLPDNAYQLFFSAKAMARCATADVGPTEREAYAGEAVTLLRRAFEKGFKGVKQARDDKDFEALRSRPDYRAVLAEFAAR